MNAFAICAAGLMMAMPGAEAEDPLGFGKDWGQQWRPEALKGIEEIPLTPCRPAPNCWVKQLAEPSAIVFTGKGAYTIGGTFRGVTPTGYIDARKRAWVSFKCSKSRDEDDGCFSMNVTRVLTHRKSPLVAVCSRGEHVNTAGGYNSGFEGCAVFDLEKRTQLIDLSHNAGLLPEKVLSGRRLEMNLFMYELPEPCREAPSPQQGMGISRRGPEYRGVVALDLSQNPPRFGRRMKLFEYSDARGETGLPPCTLP